MSLHPQPIPTIPEETVRVVHAILPEGNVWLQMRDQLGTVYEDPHFQDLFPNRGQPAEAPWRLALVRLMQYAEGLTDRQAADAVRTRIDWKYVLSLDLTDPGFDFSVLSECRSRLIAHGAERRLFDLMLDLCRERSWIKARGKQCTDSTHVLAAIRNGNGMPGEQASKERLLKPCAPVTYGKRATLASTSFRLQAFFTAAAINVLRACAWLVNSTPASAPTSRFARLVASAPLAAAA